MAAQAEAIDIGHDDSPATGEGGGWRQNSDCAMRVEGVRLSMLGWPLAVGPHAVIFGA